MPKKLRKLNRLEMAGLTFLQRNIQDAEIAFEEAKLEAGFEPDCNYHVDPDGTVHLELPKLEEIFPSAKVN